MSNPTSLQIVASKKLGGAEYWFQRFSCALAAQGAAVAVAIRCRSELKDLEFGTLPVHQLPFHTTWDPLSRRAVAALIQRTRPDIVQTYMGRATRLTQPPPGTVHLARLGGYYALAPYRHAHGWIGNTRALCEWMIANGFPAERVYHIYNFATPAPPVAPAQLAALRQQLGIPAEAWVLVTLGRFVAFKGHRHLLAALARLPATIAGRPLRLVMLGDGPLAATLRQQARATQQEQRIVWTGWQTEPTPFVQMADLVVFPSLDAEPFGNVMLDAWRCGKPLLTTQFRGAREVARHGDDAWCVPCEDDAALAAGIQTLLLDETLRRDLAARGSARVAGEFSRETIVNQYLDLYRRLTGA
ncbi:glycosyltransferase [Chromatium okenii]|uniref:glycosyltransferase n=1 Tax=Chromatium okenii TaxID=61644 RepID=UPI0019070B58|nr:glycosyltransferase [Chromatium okenii]MBK1641416.1 glycosyltransferase [Chromatium okenii]